MTNTVVFITSTTGVWNIPADFSSLISIEAIGGGGNGGGSLFNGTGGGGGGGGAYAAITSLSGLVAGGTVYVRATAAGDAWFNKTSNAAPTSTSDGVLAKGGTNGSLSTPGTGGSATNSVGSTKYAGGNGLAGTGSPSYTASGGGGAAGPSGAGSNADNTSNFQGGDANGGTLAQSSTTEGGAGQSGAIYTQSSDSATAGPGTGGNGRYSTTVAGGAGGLYGGGGGGSRQSPAGIGGGTGGNGIIVFTYSSGTEGAALLTQAANTTSAAGTVAIEAEAALTQAANTIDASGLGAIAAVGSLDLTQAANTITAAGLVAVEATASLTQDGQTLSADGVLPIEAEADITQDDNVLIPVIAASASLTQDANTVTGTAFKFAPPAAYVTAIGQRPVEMVEIIQPKCSRTFGVSPCLATGDRCWNTDATCKFREAIDLTESITLRFVPDDVFEWQDNAINLLTESGSTLVSEGEQAFLIDYLYQPALDIPTLTGYATAPTVLNVAAGSKDKSPLGYRAVSRVNIKDSPWNDILTDPYVSTRSYVPQQIGSFWTKWLARNPYHVGFVLNIYEGQLGLPLSLFTKREYVIEKIDHGRNGVSITAKDVISTITDTNVNAPFLSRGELAAAITASQTFIVVAGAVIGDYPETSYLRINNEIISYDLVYETSGGNLYFDGVTRGLAGTTAATQKENDRVQRVIYYDARPYHEIIYDLFVTWGGIPERYIDFAEWEAEKTTYRPDYNFTAYLAEPAKIDDLIAEVCLQSVSNVWWDERTQQVILRAVKPTPAPTLLTDDDAIVAGSLAIKEKPEERASQTHVYYLQRTPIPSVTEKTNYSRVAVFIDVGKQIQYGGQPQIRELFCRFISTQAIANTLAQTYLARFSDVRKEITFDLSAKDAADIWTGSVVSIRHYLDVDFTGAPREGEWLITSAEVARNGLTYRFTAEDNEKGGALWTWLDDSGNDANGVAQPYVWLDNDGNDFSGDPQPYRWL
jgi:hypothetical protein